MKTILTKIGIKLGLGNKYVRGVAGALSLALAAILPVQDTEIVAEGVAEVLNALFLLVVAKFSPTPLEEPIKETNPLIFNLNPDKEKTRNDFLSGVVVKRGINTKNLRGEILAVFPFVKEVFKLLGYIPRLTSTNEFVQGRLKNSYHYEDLAVDFGVIARKAGTKSNVKLDTQDLAYITFFLEKKLGKFYDVVVKEDHIHIEYDERRFYKFIQNK